MQENHRNVNLYQGKALIKSIHNPIKMDLKGLMKDLKKVKILSMIYLTHASWRCLNSIELRGLKKITSL